MLKGAQMTNMEEVRNVRWKIKVISFKVGLLDLIL